MEKKHNLTIIKSVLEWNLYEDLAWKDLMNAHRCQFFMHEINNNKMMVIIEWLGDQSYHSIMEFYCDPTDDRAKLTFVDNYINIIESHDYQENISLIETLLSEQKEKHAK